MDWVIPASFLNKIKLPYLREPLSKQLDFALFVDMGGGKLKRVMPTERREKFLVGAGGGIRFHIERNLFIKLDWAKAVGDRPQAGNGPSTFDVMFQLEI